MMIQDVTIFYQLFTVIRLYALLATTRSWLYYYDKKEWVRQRADSQCLFLRNVGPMGSFFAWSVGLVRIEGNEPFVQFMNARAS